MLLIIVLMQEVPIKTKFMLNTNFTEQISEGEIHLFMILKIKKLFGEEKD